MNEPRSLQEAAMSCYGYARQSTVPAGLWFCVPTATPRCFEGWAIPPFCIEAPYAIRANGEPCQTRLSDTVHGGYQSQFDRFGIPELAARSVFGFEVPPGLRDQEIALTCHFADAPCSTFATYFWPPDPQIQTPAFNMMRVARTTNQGYFTLMGYTQYRHIKELAARHAAGARDILDWGCGAARVLRYFAADPAFRATGVDIDPFNIDWCRSTFGEIAEFQAIAPMDECPFAAGSFDVVYGISVFTHLNPESERFWLGELHRLLRPGGVAIMSVHGEMTFFKGINDFWIFDRLVNEGHVDVGACNDLDVNGKPTVDENLYRNVFHTRAYIQRVWGRHFTIVDYIPGGVVAHQDYVVMIRR